MEKSGIDKIGIQDAFRYLMTGFAFLAYLAIWDLALAKETVAALGAVGMIAAALAFGGLFYVLYRGIVYNEVIVWLQDRSRRKSDNYRTYLRKQRFTKRPEQLSTEQARQLYVYFRNGQLAAQYAGTGSIFAGIHYAYMVGLMGLGFAGFAFYLGKTGPGWVYSVTSAIVLLHAFLVDRRAETDETVAIRALSQADLNAAKEKLFP